MKDSLQRQLSELVRRSPVPKRPKRKPRPAVDPLPPGSEVVNDHGAHYEVRLPLGKVLASHGGGRAVLPRPPWKMDDGPHGLLDMERPFFFDLETTGFSSSPMFLISSVILDGPKSEMIQRFARDYTEEASVVFASAEEIRSAGSLVSFNGKSYDLPFLLKRASYHRIRFSCDLPHADLLHISRRVWSGRFPDYRLQTLERYVAPVSRADDIPSSEIPDLYHRYVRHGFDPNMASVFRHNLRDVVTLVRLFAELVAADDQP